MDVCLLTLLLLYVTVETPVIVLYIVILSVRVVVTVVKLVNLNTLLSVVTNISKSLTFNPTNSHSINSSTSTFNVVSHRNVHRKPKLRKSVMSYHLQVALTAMILPTNLLWAETELKAHSYV